MFFHNSPGDWKQRLDFIVTTMKEMSVQSDPQSMVRAYATRMRELMPTDRLIALSRRGLEAPAYRITRSTTWEKEVNPWRETHKLPLYRGGLLADLIYKGEPKLIQRLEIMPDEPAAEYLSGVRSLVASPFYENGVCTNMVVLMRKEADAFNPEDMPGWVWVTSLFGRATSNLVMAGELQKAYDAVDQELKVVAEIQRSLLPAALPQVPGLDLAAHYQTSRRAGGDYYDFFPLPEGKWGVLIADVSGHGTPAAVMMAITHAIAHSHPGPPIPPRKMLHHVNQRLAARYTSNNGSFVTAFYGIYDPATLQFTYSSAGHNPPRLKRCAGGGIQSLSDAGGLPLGIMSGTEYEEAKLSLHVGDQIIFYTDGITEAQNRAGDQYGLERLDDVLDRCRPDAREIIHAVLVSVEAFTAGQPADDDRTLLVMKLV
jgi:sigma-B regulation protein RsbU (phosphoserine phosphatase)